VSAEQGEPPGAVGTINSLVGYSVRLDSHIGPKTRLAYVTYGIALKMLENGSVGGQVGTAFDEVTHVIIDEVSVAQSTTPGADSVIGPRTLHRVRLLAHCHAVIN